MSKINFFNEPVQENPPEKLQVAAKGSKYDAAIETAVANPGIWYKVASGPNSNRSSMYSIASAIRGGRLGNIPDGERIEVMVRRVEDEVNLYIRGL